MNNKTFIELRDIAYDAAKAKGYFTDNQPKDAYIAAIHEELSEAFRAINKAPGNIEDAPWLTLDNVSGKWDGIYMELVDAVIRLLSFSGYMGYELNEDEELTTDRPYIQDDIYQVINRSHGTLSYMYNIDEDFNRAEIEESIRSQDHLSKQTQDEIISRKLAVKLERNNELRGQAIKEFIDRIERFIEESSEDNGNSLDLISLIEMKMSYNATRPIKHGGNKV